MSYDLMAFEVDKAPGTKEEFMDWYQEQAEWSEDHKYDNPAVTSVPMQAFYLDMIRRYPNMNQRMVCEDEEEEDGEEDLESRMSGYCIGYDVIYITFAWSQAQGAYAYMRSCCQKHGVGFFDASSSRADVIFPDGRIM